jgi:hypothetical protein
MNYRGPYRKLHSNSVSAILAALEIYNKPRFPHRDEVVSILLINAWELLLKAVVSKSGQSIYFPKERGKPYRTIGLTHALKRAASSSIWPSAIDQEALALNLELLTQYRNRSVHFYNEPGFGSVVYSLMQTAIHNYRDLAQSVFGKDLADEITWEILPLGIRTPIDPVQYLQSATDSDGQYNTSNAVGDFIDIIRSAQSQAAEDGTDINRVLTLYSVNLQSTKKLTDAHLVVGVKGDEDAGSATVIHRRQDPNETHPLRQMDVLPLIRAELKVSPHTFQAITRVRNLRVNPRYCWQDGAVNLVRWSREVVTYINRLSLSEIETILAEDHKERGALQRARNLDKRGGRSAKPRPW